MTSSDLCQEYLIPHVPSPLQSASTFDTIFLLMAAIISVTAIAVVFDVVAIVNTAVVHLSTDSFTVIIATMTLNIMTIAGTAAETNLCVCRR